MKTLRLTVDPQDPHSESSRRVIETAAEILRRGGLVAFPTETVYGLGANALDAQSVEKIFQAKQRPTWDPLIVHVSDSAMLTSVAASEPALSPSARSLIAAFWPGPLTLLLPKSEAVPPIVTAGRPLVGVRMPSHPVANALIAAAGLPIAAPSANSFGRISPTRASHVLEDLDGRIDAVLDGGDTTHGLESTVVDASQEPVIVYRPGMISLQQIRGVCASVSEWKSPQAATPSQPRHEDPTPESMPSPGLGIRHYAPRARLVLIGGLPAELSSALVKAGEQAAASHHSVGIMLPENFLPSRDATLPAEKVTIFNWGDWNDLPMLAHRLFDGLRQLDAAGVEVILCPLPPGDGLAVAIQDRLQKAARTK